MARIRWQETAAAAAAGTSLPQHVQEHVQEAPVLPRQKGIHSRAETFKAEIREILDQGKRDIQQAFQDSTLNNVGWAGARK